MDYTIIIPTYNEAQNINYLIPFLQRQGAKRIVIANSPATTDESAAVAIAYGVEILACPKAGRAAQMNYAAFCTDAELLYFVHADTVPPSSFLQDILAALRKGYDLGYFRYQFDDQRLLLRLNSYCTRFDGVFAGGGVQTLFILRPVFET